MSFAKATISKFENAIREARAHFKLFGIHGLFLVIKSRLLRKRTQVKLNVPGFSHPLHLRLRTSDVRLFSTILMDSQYACGDRTTPKVIVDGGANIGLTSVWYANQYPQARIFAIEPEPSNFEMLRQNTTPYTNITPIRAAIWKEDCELNMFDPDGGVWGFWGFRIAPPDAQGASPGRRWTVPGVTISSVMKDNGIDFIDLLKLDVEGAEKELFENSTAWINRVGSIAVETHDWFKQGCRDSMLAATKGFGTRWERGEITFIQRSNPAGEGFPTRGLTEVVCSHSTPRLPLKIRECQPVYKNEM